MGAYLCVREYRLSVKLQDLNNAEFIDSNLRPVSKPVTLASAPSNHKAAAVQADFKKLQENAAEIVKNNPIRYRMNTLSYRPLSERYISPSASPTPGPRATYKRAALALLPPPVISPRAAYPSMSITPSSSPGPDDLVTGEMADPEVKAGDDYDLVSRISLLILMLVVFCGLRFCFAKPATRHTNYINRDPRPVLPTIRRRAASPGAAAGHGGWLEEDDVRIDARDQQQQQHQWTWQAQEQQIMQDRLQEIQNNRRRQQQQQRQNQERLVYYYTHRND
jgi:hypothetical protein